MKSKLKEEHKVLILKGWSNLTEEEKRRVLYLDEKLCVKGSLSDDRKLMKERLKEE